jgi:hypothetical protein
MPNTLLEGYQPVDRQNEQVQNCWVDTQEFNNLDTTDPIAANNTIDIKDNIPAFHEWATVIPGTILVREKRAPLRFKQQMAAETASPVVGCAACKGADKDDLYFFAGVARTPSVREFDDGKGPSMDEMFTMFIGGKATILNNGASAIYAGDMVEWTFFDLLAGVNPNSIAKPRRIQVRSIDSTSGTFSKARVIGRSLNFAKTGELFDILIQQ